jgi:hypothetical protein
MPVVSKQRVRRSNQQAPRRAAIAQSRTPTYADQQAPLIKLPRGAHGAVALQGGATGAGGLSVARNASASGVARARGRPALRQRPKAARRGAGPAPARSTRRRGRREVWCRSGFDSPL